MTAGVAGAPVEAAQTGAAQTGAAQTGAAQTGAAQTGALADQIVSAVTGCPDVAGLARMPGSPVATYLPGRTVSGVALRPGQVEICLVARYGRPLKQIAAQVRRAVAPLVPGRVVDVVVADITPPGERPRAVMAPASRRRNRRGNAKREESANG